MYDWEEGPYTDDLHIWEDKMEKEYEDFLEENCSCLEDCECISLALFKDQYLKDVADIYEEELQQKHEGLYA
jgi:hypothetical protein